MYGCTYVCTCDAVRDSSLQGSHSLPVLSQADFSQRPGVWLVSSQFFDRPHGRILLRRCWSAGAAEDRPHDGIGSGSAGCSAQARIQHESTNVKRPFCLMRELLAG